MTHVEKMTRTPMYRIGAPMYTLQLHACIIRILYMIIWRPLMICSVAALEGRLYALEA